MEAFLKMFEQAVRKQAEVVGNQIAHEQAKMAGLGLSAEGQVISCTGNPQLVLLRLIKCFTAGGNIQALNECTPLINRLLESLTEAEQKNESPAV